MNAWLLLMCLGYAALWGCSGTESGAGRETVVNDLNDAPWPMHAIDSRFRGANALSSGDADQDGFADYVTNYEFDQRIVISFHPGAGDIVRQPWPTVVAWMPKPLANGNGVDPEHSALCDLDGDGNLDVAVSQGESNMPFWEGSQPLADEFDNETGGVGEWSWIQGREPVQLSRGSHVVNLRVREGGYAADRILLTTDAALVPAEKGLEETISKR